MPKISFSGPNKQAADNDAGEGDLFEKRPRLPNPIGFPTHDPHPQGEKKYPQGAPFHVIAFFISGTARKQANEQGEQYTHDPSFVGCYNEMNLLK